MNILITRPSSVSALSAAVTLILCCTLTAGAARAQDLDDATISGRVADETGAVVVKAFVTAVRTANNLERSVVTDAEGRYRFIELEPGAYTVRAGSAGFTAEERSNLRIIAGQNVRLDFTLRPAGVIADETIVSETDAPPVDTTRTIVGGTVTRDEIEALPSRSRAALDFVFTLPGVTEEPLTTRDAAEDRDPNSSSAENRATTPEEAGAFALSGGAAYSNNITIDGLDNNDDRAARERFQPSLEAIEEVQVITNQFSAEYGRASGGRVNLRTRGGTKDVRGRLFYFFRDESLDANTFNNNRRGLSRLPLQQHNPGFTLSAPVRISRERFGPLGYDGRDRTFFFTAYEYDTVLDSALIDTLWVHS